MKVVYGETTICGKLEAAITNAKQPIKQIQLTELELREFCEETGYAFQKGARYTYKGHWIVYDWGRE